MQLMTRVQNINRLCNALQSTYTHTSHHIQSLRSSTPLFPGTNGEKKKKKKKKKEREKNSQAKRKVRREKDSSVKVVCIKGCV